MKNSSHIKYGYIDESGTPGVAVSRNDWLVVSLVIFDSREAADKAVSDLTEMIARLGLPTSYELHRTHNSTRIQVEVEKVLRKTKFSFVSVAIRKNQLREHATYRKIAEQLFGAIKSMKFEKFIIKMDSNPVLKKELARSKKISGLKGISFKEYQSDKYLELQLADYVANLCARAAKGNVELTKDQKAILGKAQSVIII
ncbi:DUF3800 domain-containing protein [Candidatus Saccharibacteria bacterium]|nr:DUF3800 domain-containing protein [Candidatus Saccharibacteria bacterium]